MVSATRLPLALALIGCGGCEEPVAPPDAGASSTAVSSSGDAEPPLTACGGYAWGPDWPGKAGQPSTPTKLEPRYPETDCGPGCRMVGTRLNFANAQPYEFRFSGTRMVSSPVPLDGVNANYVDLVSGDDYEANAVAPESGLNSYSQTTMGGDCFAKQYIYEDASTRRCYVCEICSSNTAMRLLAYAEGPITMGGTSIYTYESSGRYLVINRKGAISVIDVHDGSEHLVADDDYLVTEVSTIEPYLVFPQGDGEIWLVDLRDWSKTNVSNDAATLQYMSSSDGKRIAWIDFRYSADQTAAEVVVYDIDTKQLTRVTDTQASPSGKFYPTVEGDWVAWMDDRDSSGVNASIDTPRDRFDIYGYNLATKQEVHLVGNEAGEITNLYPVAPQLYGGKVYVLGHNIHAANRQLYEFAVPSP